MTPIEFDEAVSESQVFARIEPDTKRKIVNALKRRGEYVAMVGDGVNDVPALKAADLAIVMNDGTQISKDVADIVLLNNAMSTLPLAFREGREITQTIFGSIKMFLAKNAYNFIMFLLIGFAAMPFAITPRSGEYLRVWYGQHAGLTDCFWHHAPQVYRAFSPRCAGLYRHGWADCRYLCNGIVWCDLYRLRRESSDGT